MAPLIDQKGNLRVLSMEKPQTLHINAGVLRTMTSRESTVGAVMCKHSLEVILVIKQVPIERADRLDAVRIEKDTTPRTYFELTG